MLERAAGCPAVGSDGICTKDGTKAEFTLDLRSSDSQQQNVGLRVKAWAAEVGIKIDLDTITEDALNAKIYNPTSSKAKADADKYKPTFDAFIWGWFGDLTTPDYDFEVLACGNPSSDSFWCDKRYTDLTNRRSPSQPQEAGRPAAPGRADRARRVALHHLRLRALPLGDADRHLDELPALAAAHRPAVRRELDPAPAHQPRSEAGTSYAGTTWVIAFLVGTTALIVSVGYIRRRREERQPFELPAPTAPRAAGR